MAQAREKNGKFRKKDTYKCPNCGNTKFEYVHDFAGIVLKSQKQCIECAHVLTTE